MRWIEVNFLCDMSPLIKNRKEHYTRHIYSVVYTYMCNVTVSWPTKCRWVFLGLPDFLTNVLGLQPGGCVFCILETNHDRRMSWRPKLFMLTRRLQVQWLGPRRTVLILSHVPAIVFCSSEIEHVRRAMKLTKLFVSTIRLITGTMATTPKYCYWFGYRRKISVARS